jgi:hypothetical protein
MSAQLGTVRIVDKTDSEYVLPQVNITELRRVLPEDGRISESAPMLFIVNAAMATLSVPLRVVCSVSIDEEEVWRGQL